MLRRLFYTDGGIAGLLLRITLAIVRFPHGAQMRVALYARVSMHDQPPLAMPYKSV